MSMENVKKIKHNYIFYKKRLLALSFIIIVLTILSFNNHYLFHIVAEITSCAFAYAIFLFSINANKIIKNKFFVILGIGYLFVLIFLVLHTFTYERLNIFLSESYDAETKFWIIAGIIEAGTFLLASFYLFKKELKPNYYIIVIVYIIISALLIADVLYIKILIPDLRIEGVGITKTKIYAEYIIIFCLIISYLVIQKYRYTNHAIFSFIMVALMLKIISQMFFVVLISITEFYNLMGHLLKVCSYYLIYTAIIENGIYRPFEMLSIDLINANSKSEESEIQRQYLEEIITQNEHCYELIIQNSYDCIVIVKDYKIIYANKTAIRTAGAKDILDLLNKSIWDFTFVNYETQLLEGKLKENINSNRFFRTKLKNLNGNILTFEYSFNDITYRGSRAYLVLLKDITHKEEIKMLQNDLVESEVKLSQSMELNKELTEFFSNISHELKTPLNIILGSIQLILQNEDGQTSSLTEKHKKLLYITKQNALRLVRLVNNLIDISKFDAGYLQLNNQNCNIVNIVEDISLSVSEFFKTKGINIIFDTNTEEKIMAVDCDKIERIILNLLSNSMKFTDKGGEVWVTLTDMGEYIQISVRDTGIGIPEEKLSAIFNRFEQVDKTFARKREGSGIGLALVKNLVELHGGSINVSSKINEGTEFIITLPVMVLEDEICLTNDFDSKVDKINIEFSDIYS